MQPEYDFGSDPPDLGYVHEHNGQRYVLIDVLPRVRNRDNVDSYLLVWESHCICGAVFQAAGGMKTNGLVRRCDTHKANRKKRPLSPQAAERLAKREVKEAREAAKEAIPASLPKGFSGERLTMPDKEEMSATYSSGHSAAKFLWDGQKFFFSPRTHPDTEDAIRGKQAEIEAIRQRLVAMRKLDL